MTPLRRQFDRERHAVGPDYPHATFEAYAAFVAAHGHVFPLNRRGALVAEARAMLPREVRRAAR